MLDEYLWGNVDRISPEAPVPVVKLERRTYVLGGAANVACNIIALGGRAVLAGIVGNDSQAKILVGLLTQNNIEQTGLLTDPARPTTTKTRILAHSQQVLRLDVEGRGALKPELENELLEWVAHASAAVNAFVLSDYNKGVVTPRIAQGVIERANAQHKPVIVDPKGSNYSKYRGATVITPNVREAAQALRLDLDGDCDLLEIGAQLSSQLEQSALVITRGAEGMSLFENGKTTKHMSANAKNVFDVTGAGDTVISTLALALTAGMGLEAAAHLANIAAGIVVGKVGTATVSREELAAAWEGELVC